MPNNFEKATTRTAVHLGRIMRLMYTAKWVTGRSHREYAKKYGISADRAKHLSAEASKRIKKAVFDRDAVGAIVGSSLQAVVLEALADSRRAVFVERGVTKDGSPITYQLSPNEARKVVIEGAKALAQITGAGAAERVEITGKDGGPLNYAAMTDEQLLAILHRAGVSDPGIAPAPDEPDKD